MNALLYDQPGMRPIPAHGGFSVNTHSDPERHLCTDTSTDGNYHAKPVMNFSGYLRIPAAGACPHVGEPKRPSTPGFRSYGEDAELSDEADDSMELSTPTSVFKDPGYITITAGISNSSGDSDKDLALVLDSLRLSTKLLSNGPMNGKSATIARPRKGGASFIC
ncbi:hypothetical protein BD779DRAFT_1677221 [Infundibulicybe gibba]|nr:hypothetical protein BD779DRAFT_1677221 [Infundibulicybe gibba]